MRLIAHSVFPRWLSIVGGIVFCTGVIVLILYSVILSSQTSFQRGLLTEYKDQSERVLRELDALRNEDQYVTNAKLRETNASIQTTFADALTVYERLVDLRALTTDTKKLDASFAAILSLLSLQHWATASAEITALSKKIAEVKTALSPDATLLSTASPHQGAPPSGYFRERVESSDGPFVIDGVAADLSSTKVIVDTASEQTCANECPTLPLSAYVSRNGAYAGINGSYFCPAEYPSCAGKTNSFDTLLMNSKKVYFNSDNNVYSVVPAVIFLGSSVRFVGKSLEWGRDTSPDGVLANRPLLVFGGALAFSGQGEAKEEVKGNRSFVGNKGSTVYIGVVHNATVSQSARVLLAFGLENAMNLDDGGSTALWYSGYKVGPGRNVPNALLFVRK